MNEEGQIEQRAISPKDLKYKGIGDETLFNMKQNIKVKRRNTTTVKGGLSVSRD